MTIDFAPAATEGYIPFRGYQTWYRSVGEDAPGKLSLLLLHGGPGIPSDYFEPLEKLATGGRRVIRYDQLGCGKSDRPDDPSLWTVDLFLEELRTVIAALGLGRVHLLGHSWGGMLALEYVFTKPTGVASLVLASSPVNMADWARDAVGLRTELPPEVQATLTEHEEAATTDSEEYRQAMMEFYGRFVCRLPEWPEPVLRSLEGMGAQVYETMCGPSEFHVTGTLRDWDVSGRLGEVTVPTLITSGRYDEATPAQMEVAHRGIAGSRWVVFEESAHMAHLEEEAKCLRTVEEFLAEVEATLV
jgi:L-proline amide hydrolase